MAKIASGLTLVLIPRSFFDFTLHTTSKALLFLILAALATQDSRVNQRLHSRHRRTRSRETEPEPAQPPTLEEAKTV
jgi:hypothetical protein